MRRRGGEEAEEGVLNFCHIPHPNYSHQVYWPACDSQTCLMSQDLYIIQGSLFPRGFQHSHYLLLELLPESHVSLSSPSRPSMLRTSTAHALYTMTFAFPVSGIKPAGLLQKSGRCFLTEGAKKGVHCSG